MKKLPQSLNDWLTALAATVLGLLLSVVVVRLISSIADFISDGEEEVMFTDIYAKVADRRSVAVLSDDVVIASVDGCSRERIAQVIDAVNFFGPSAVGLDLFFTYPSEEGQQLALSIRDCDNIVLPMAVGRDNSSSFFYGDFPADYAAVNMISSSTYDVIRDYVTLFKTDSVDYSSMAQALLVKAGKEIPSATSQERRIWYPSVDFEVIEADDLIDEDGFPEMSAAEKLEGKIVLIGVTEDLSDIHRTPVDEEMPGIMIHAHIIDTIVNDRHLHEVGPFWNILIAVVICLLFLRLQIAMKNILDDVGELVMRVVQLVMMYLLLVVGANLYIRHGVYVDFSIALVMLGLSLTFLTLIKGGIYLYEKYLKK